MSNETPRFIDKVAGARPSHQWPGPRLPDTELPTWAAYLVIVYTGAPEPDGARSDRPGRQHDRFARPDAGSCEH